MVSIKIILSQLVLVGLVSGKSLSLTALDFRTIEWPLAEKDSPIQCYTELDSSFIGGTHRVNASQQIYSKPCMIRIPTHTEIKFNPVHFLSDDTYVRVIAGSSIVHAPLASPKVHRGDKEHYGPWHVPCSYAYVVFNAVKAQHEILEFRLTPENEDDVEGDPRENDCFVNGLNYALMEKY
ncbi:hypothetical protein Ddc_17445 [Ditylenchus destructor]|nr:hypothetical protein Ddc_17445 [Ditylenchus destructor]